MIIDGKKIAAEVRKELALKIKELGIRPTLFAIIMGDNPSGHLYVDKKIEAANEVGIIASKVVALNQKDLEYTIRKLNKDSGVNAYILQLPIPENIDPLPIFSMFDPKKDVDVFHPENVGFLVQGRPRFKPCTPHGIQVMLSRSGIQVSGKKVVIINRSNVVGKPLSSMLIQDNDEYANATVTVCHDKTPPQLLKELTLKADIVVVAVGKPGFITPDMIDGAGIVDVGITRVGNKILGDLDPAAREKAAWWTPVPGGVGPMTVAMLLENTFQAALYNSR